ncbi:MAG TPA: CHAD domain-containing protein [Solirubrobacterales bacterium]|jgi:CHAD domain-containing protein|nr:CHAD domain-containing protein [Solirubrobacterales bacterium]
MAKARTIELSATEAYRDAAARVVAARGAELTEQAQGVLDTGDIERVHDMRVATRRLRASLEVFEPCFPRRAHRRVLREVKRLADGLGARRDRDVAISALDGFNRQMPVPDRKGVSSLVSSLREEQASANAALATLVDPVNLGALGESIEELVESAAGRHEV